ncbi:uncharacterized protein A1O9_03372 [Exophiala aquamarina CBS 119918]|uniref:Uncharacterized protein n=1 Tax=Exophiala aquamarina CBS 119918 TaxID=1182545 RepID=A0A072PQ25_9EURO|nr:uncharacterized protein A1O9_03372 [Exophiala aquamarina CBS 119918]KEF61802.1 hypothetical protein A1O9_03372 [Exophiala aquamarina CBS 119918]
MLAGATTVRVMSNLCISASPASPELLQHFPATWLSQWPNVTMQLQDGSAADPIGKGPGGTGHAAAFGSSIGKVSLMTGYPISAIMQRTYVQGDDNSPAMSRSSTTETVNPSVHELLQAYNVHHTGTDEEVRLAPQPSIRRQQAQLDSPNVYSSNRTSESPPAQIDPNDVSSRRRVPPYRETSRDHDLSLRPGGRDSTEATIVQVMFVGVYITGALNRWWRQTGGRLNDKFFQYEVGGEW